MALSVILWGLVAISVVTSGYWLVTLYHIVRTLVRVPSLRDGLANGGKEESKSSASVQLSGEVPTVCVIVPAHNEERVIGTLCDALLSQDYSGLNIVFALDRCTDQTEAIIRQKFANDARCEIIAITHCPETWVGKVHALHVAGSASRAARESDLLLFLDADTIPKPTCVRAAVGLMQQRGDDLLSVLSTLTSDRWFERVVQPAAGIELMRQYPMVRANDRRDPRTFANGQFILVRRSLYQAIGGHEAVKEQVLEDVWLARTFARAGHQCGFYFSGDQLHCRMYEEWGRFRRGWLRIYGECASRKPGRLRRSAWIVRCLSCVFPVVSAVCAAVGLIAPYVMPREIGDDGVVGVARVAGAVGFVAWLGVMMLIYRLGRTPVWTAPASIVGGWLVAELLSEAARNYEKGRPVVWGGREYRREKR